MTDPWLATVLATAATLGARFEARTSQPGDEAPGAPIIDIPDWLMLRATWLETFGEDW